MLTFLFLLTIVISVLVAVAFFTLFERKLLGYIQLRKGPNKVGFTGIFQPFADAIKLFTKEHVSPTISNYYPFVLSPAVSLFLSLLVWCTLPVYNFMSFDLSVLFFLTCVGIGVYSLLASGWTSNSKYSLLGALRGVAQTISYEVSLALVLLAPVILVGNFNLLNFHVYQSGCWFVFVTPLRALVWFVSCLAETNRTPFDFAEGESELVSGYNTEYRSGGFALIILAEYTSILFMCGFIGVLFFGGGTLVGGIIVIFLFVAFVWVRGTLPRLRYDKLMSLAWKTFLPFSLAQLIILSGFIYFFIL